jgi:uncharacterized protein YecE (DUF72 family)
VIKVGCCGFPIRKGSYYKEFKVVEVQKTFYDPRNVNTFRRWRDEAPPDFEFTIKAWQGVTHSVKSPTWKRYKGDLIGNKEKYGLLKYSQEVLWAWKQTLAAANALNANKIVVQLPPSLKWDGNKEEISKTLKYIVSSGMKIIVEPRHPSWFSQEVYKLFRDNNIVFCTDPLKNGIVDTDNEIIYLRLHGIGGYKYRYKDEDLQRIKDIIGDYQNKKVVYVMFNNVYMYEDAKRFIDILKKR